MFGGIMAILASAPFFLAGFETIPQGVEDAGGDITNVGKTVVLSVCLACVFYAILLFCFGLWLALQEFAHMANPSASTMFLNLYPGAVGEVLYWLITLGAIAGLFTTWNGFFMASASLLMGMGRGCLVPKVFAKQNKNGIPVPGLIVCLVLSLIGPFLGAGLIQDITSFSAAAFVLSWTITSYSLIRLRKKEPNLERPYKIPGGIAMGAFSAIVTTVVFVLLFIPNNPVYMGKTASIMFGGLDGHWHHSLPCLRCAETPDLSGRACRGYVQPRQRCVRHSFLLHSFCFMSVPLERQRHALSCLFSRQFVDFSCIFLSFPVR